MTGAARTEYHRAYRERNRERVNANQRNWRARNTDAVRRYMEIDREKHREKHAARHAVGQAIKTGRLERQPCEMCGTTEKVHAHHEDYSKPLDVRWLCSTHHMEMHW